MESNKHIDQEVEKTMKALDELEPAKTDAFFYSRLSTKLEHRNEPAAEKSLIPNFGFAFSVAAVILLLFLNLASISLYQQVFMSEETEREELMEELAYDYQVFDLNYYETLEEE